MAECPEQAVFGYMRAHWVFVRIRSFFDGNGRMARLLANLPGLAADFPPLVLPMACRAEYIGLL